MSDLSKRITALPAKKYELLLRRLNRERAESALPQLVPQPRDANGFPLSFAQQRLWVLTQFEPDNPLYTIPIAMRLTGALDLGALEASFDALIQRHMILRTTFIIDADGLPCQVIAPALTLQLPLVDLQDRPAAQRELEAQRLIAAESDHIFDLVHGPLLRAMLLRLAPTTHILLMSMHHIIADGWSIGVLTQDLIALYAALHTGAPAPLHPLAIQYADYAVWQRQRITSGALAHQRAYWQAQLAGTPVLQLPSDHTRPAIQTYRSASQPLTLSAELVAALNALGQQTGATLFMTLTAAFTAFLSRLTEQTDFSVGALVAGRIHPDLEGLIGFFVNNLALRTDLSGDPTARELLNRVRTITLEAYTNQDLPFEQVLEALQLDRTASHPPLFQVMCVLQNVPHSRQVLPGLTLCPLRTASRRSGFDLTLWLWEDGAQLIGELEYNPYLFESVRIARLVGNLRTLLTNMIESPERRIGSLSLLTKAEWWQLVVEWNTTARTEPLDERLHELVAAQAARTPDAIAVVFDATTDDERRPAQDDRRWTSDQRPTQAQAGSSLWPCVSGPQQLTYAALEQRANQVAHHLRALGVGPETLVGVCIERSLELVVGLLGVLKAGGAYVPIDPIYPAARRAFMLEDTGAAAILTATTDDRQTTNDDRATSPFVPRPPAFIQTLVLDLIADWPVIARMPTTHLDSGIAPESLAYVIYTSGSTGRPKGAMNRHRGICNRLRWMQATYRLEASDSVLQKTPISFDVSVWEFFWPLMSGARLVLARPGGQRDSAYLVRLISQQMITTLHFVPSMLRVFLSERNLAMCRCLRRVICSGEALSIELQDLFFAQLDATLHNLYGPTEAAVDVTAWTCERAAGQCALPIGRPIANSQIYVLDRQLQPAPIGAPGELYLGGIQLARGYLGRPELTATTFVPSPFTPTIDRHQTTDDRAMGSGRWSVVGGRLYKTGDLARYQPDGAIEFLGRIDHQVKLRGYRIELGEIETALAQYPAVCEAAVLALEESPGDKRLVGYVVPCREQETGNKKLEGLNIINAPLSPIPYRLSPTELRAFLRELLPEYMIPSVFMVLDALPLTPSGKVDRRALPPPDQDQPAMERGFAAPHTPAEELLAKIWTQILGVKQVGIHDNFFALGGHSLLLARLMFRLRDELPIDLPLRILFEQPTIAELALTVEELLLNEVAHLSEEEALEQLTSIDEFV